jgi:hypothetical protein
LTLANGDWKRNFYSRVMALSGKDHLLDMVFLSSFSVLPARLGLTILHNHLIDDLSA